MDSMNRKPSRPFPSLLATLAALAALAAAPARAQDRSYLTLNPTLAEAAKPFSLKVLSYRWNCGHGYTDKSSTRTGSRIDLRFAVHPAKDPVICPRIEKPYGPEIGVNALPEGRYEVWAAVLAPCQVAKPSPCEMAEIPERIGVLTVGAANTADWFIQPSTIRAGQDFNLQVLNNRYNSCWHRFSNATHAVQDTRIGATFSMTIDTTVFCFVSESPWGPSYAMKGLKAGKYPVSIALMPSCAFDPQPCPMIPPIPRVVDTLTVTGGVTAVPSPGTGSDASAASTSPKAFLAGGHLQVTLPETTGPWTAELVDLKGRRIAALGSLQAGNGRALIAVDARKWPTGLLWLRLRGPDRIEILPVLH